MILDEVMKLANKFIPDKSNQEAFKVEMAKIDKEDFVNRKSLLEKVIPVTFPILVWVMAVGLISNILAGWISLIFKCETPIYVVDSYHFELIKIFLISFFSKRTIEQFTTKK